METRERIREILGQTIGAENVEAWLAAPHPDLGHISPNALMEDLGEAGAQVVLTLLEDALRGQMS